MTVDANNPTSAPEQQVDISTSDLPSATHIQHTLVNRYAPFLYIFLIIYGAVILISNNNPLEFFAILGLLSINILGTIINKNNYMILRLISGSFALGVSVILYGFAQDPANALIAFFYLLIIFYAFVLSAPYNYIFIALVAVSYTLAFLVNSAEGGFGEFFARLSLMLILGGIMSFVREAVMRSIADRTQLLRKLKVARDEYARQLTERTAELQQEIQEHEHTESRLAEEHQLLQTIIDTFPSRLFVKDRMSRFTMVNRQSLKHLQLEDTPEAIIGKSDFDFYPEFAERTFADEQHLMDTGEPVIDLEEKVINDDGDEHYYLINKVPLLHPKSNEVVGLVGVTTDVTSIKEIQHALRQSQESLRLFQLRLKTLNQITLELTRIDVLDVLIYKSIQYAIDRLGFSRLNCWFSDPDDPDYVVGSYWVNLNGEIVPSHDQVMRLDLFEPIKNILKGQPIHHVERDVPIYDMDFNVIGHGDKAFTALLDGDKVIGCLYTDNLLDGQPFTDSQVELLNLYGATLGALVNRQRAQEAVRISEEQALNFQQKLRRLHEVTLELESVQSLEEMCKQAIILGTQKLGFERMGIWLTVDDQPEMRRGMWGIDPEGNLRDERDKIVKILPHEANMVTEGDVRILRNHQLHDITSGELITHGWLLIGLMWDGTKRIGWLYADNAITHPPFYQNLYELFRLYVAMLGVRINRIYTQEALRISEENALSFQQQLKTLNEVTLSLESAESVDDLCRKAVIMGRSRLNFDRLGIWLAIEGQPGVSRGTWGTDKHGNLRDERHMQLPIPEHQNDLISDGEIVVLENFTDCEVDGEMINIEWSLTGFMGDKAKRVGWVSTDNAFSGVPLTKNIHELFRLYVATLAVLIDRQQTQEELRASEQEAQDFQQQLKTLHEVTLALEAADSLEDLCRQVILLGTQQLGFDRLGMWLTIEGEENRCRGTWGIDADGNLRDERHLEMPIPDYQELINADGDVLVLRDKERTHQGAEMDPDPDRIGWVLNALMSDGQRHIGWISADNAIHNKPLTPNQQELFRIYVATISLLYTRRLADNLLREREIRYRAITEASTDIIAIVNRDLIVTYISPSLYIIMGIEPDTIIGQSVVDVIHRDDVAEARRILLECIDQSHRQTRMNEFRVRHVKGHWVHMEAVVISQIDNPAIGGILISCRDLTQRLIAEEGKRIVERERERALVLRQFISDISHDFRTPLSTITTAAYLLQHSKSKNIEQRVEMINQQVERLANLIDNLNTITKLDEMGDITMERLDVNTILQSIPYHRNDIIQSKQLSLQLDLQENLPPITGNIGLLRDAINHVIDNAVQYSESNDSILIQSYQDVDCVVVQIADTGVGISEEDLPYIFDRLYRADKSRNTNTGGSGLGLAITRRIIDLHQGSIKVTSQLTEGTLVTIELPHVASISALK